MLTLSKTEVEFEKLAQRLEGQTARVEDLVGIIYRDEQHIFSPTGLYLEPPGSNTAYDLPLAVAELLYQQLLTGGRLETGSFNQRTSQPLLSTQED